MPWDEVHAKIRVVLIQIVHLICELEHLVLYS